MTKGRRVLVVEDEALVRLLLEDMLEDLGHEVHDSISEFPAAERVAKEAAFDVAILDVRLNGIDVYPVADLLAERGVPFVFATGFAETGLPTRFRDRPTLQKPFQQAELERALAQALSQPSDR